MPEKVQPQPQPFSYDYQEEPIDAQNDDWTNNELLQSQRNKVILENQQLLGQMNANMAPSPMNAAQNDNMPLLNPGPKPVPLQ